MPAYKVWPAFKFRTGEGTGKGELLEPGSGAERHSLVPHKGGT